MKIFKNFFFIFLMIMCSCTENVQITEEERKELEAEIRSTLERYLHHLETNGLKGVERFYSEDERFFWVEDGALMYPNRETIMQGLRGFEPQIKTIQVSIKESKVDILNNRFAMLYFEYLQTFELKSGYTLAVDGATSVLLIPEADSWKFLMGHSSTKKQRSNQ